MTSALAVEDVSHSFGKVKALDHVSLNVEKGQFVALLGINGAGKTTLFSLITRLYDNVTGSIRVTEYDVRRQPGPALARLGIVFQTRALDADLTVWQNFLYHASLHGMSRREARERTRQVIARVELTDKLDARVSTLSGGQQRRAEIARSLLHRPRLLLLDEATVGLDVKSRHQVNRLVRDLVDEEDVAVLWATHLFDEVLPDDKVVILHQGQVLKTGLAHEIAGGRPLEEAFLKLTGSSGEAVTCPT